MGYLVVLGKTAISFEVGPRRCPFCESALVHTSHKMSVAEKLFFPLLMMRPFRCGLCGERHLEFHFRTFNRDAAAKTNIEEMPREVMFRQPRPKAFRRLEPNFKKSASENYNEVPSLLNISTEQGKEHHSTNNIQ